MGVVVVWLSPVRLGLGPFCPNRCPSSRPSCFSAKSPAAAAFSSVPVSKLFLKLIPLRPKSINGASLRLPVALAADDGSVSTVEDESGSDSDEILPIDKLPLESKLQQKLEQKMRMKLAKKIRLRRKKLVRKRRMRKKGRWPPSKMAKLKNV